MRLEQRSFLQQKLNSSRTHANRKESHLKTTFHLGICWIPHFYDVKTSVTLSVNCLPVCGPDERGRRGLSAFFEPRRERVHRMSCSSEHGPTQLWRQAWPAHTHKTHTHAQRPPFLPSHCSPGIFSHLVTSWFKCAGIFRTKHIFVLNISSRIWLSQNLIINFFLITITDFYLLPYWAQMYFLMSWFPWLGAPSYYCCLIYLVHFSFCTKYRWKTLKCQ